MKVLVACEESQTVCKAFRKRGHEAYSCDLEPCSGGHPEWHYREDVTGVLQGKDWDLVIAHPPCTYLANSGVCHLYDKKGFIKECRWLKMERAARFFKMFLDYKNCPVAIENPIMHKYAVEIIGRRQDQVIQPYMFGHKEQKATCLWLENVPILKETNNVYDEMMELPESERQRLHYLPPSKDRQKIRSKTFPGIAEAMASQWTENRIGKVGIQKALQL